ncbi:RrF2 family transcriptional regulator [Butyrivibrio sp. VCB2006]|uniref:RrF2 family transcriptional regulator n=1 Tax=Butyrivibrio sp. VCB2006 TaxID=1280679 RepID=UPI0004112D06|nr:Rrf2 family transcriptional regulator [Butyrivibrio sp. VCB2006]
MRISTKGRYGLRVMTDLAVHYNGEYIALKDIAIRLDITVKYLEQIVTALNKAGYLESMRGTNGGHRLAKDPSEYVVGDILRVMEGNFSPVECSAEGMEECPLSDTCASLNFWKGLDDVVNKYIDSYTLDQLVMSKPSQK